MAYPAPKERACAQHTTPPHRRHSTPHKTPLSTYTCTHIHIYTHARARTPFVYVLVIRALIHFCFMMCTRAMYTNSHTRALEKRHMCECVWCGRITSARLADYDEYVYHRWTRLDRPEHAHAIRAPFGSGYDDATWIAAAAGLRFGNILYYRGISVHKQHTI